MRNISYLGRVNLVELSGLRIAGVSGIYKQSLFQLNQRASVTEIGSNSNKDYISFIESEISEAMDYTSVDILLLHDWASGIISSEDLQLFKQRYSNARFEQVGNEYARLLIEALQPQLVLCGHLHFKYRYSLPLSLQKISNICCLANVQQGKDSMAIFRITAELKIIEVTD